MDVLYKFLTKDGFSPYKGFEFVKGRWYGEGCFSPGISPGRGFHALTLEGLPALYNYKWNLWECEVKEQRVERSPHLRRYQWMRITERVMPTDLKGRCKEWSRMGPFNLHDLLWPPIQPQEAPDDLQALAKAWEGVKYPSTTSVCEKLWGRLRFYSLEDVDEYYSELLKYLHRLSRRLAVRFDDNVSKQASSYLLSLFNEEGCLSPEQQRGADLLLKGIFLHDVGGGFSQVTQ